jgi:hypothetical protein
MVPTARAACRLAPLGLLLAACAGGYETFAPAPLDYSDRPPLRFAVASVDVQEAYQPAGQPPFVEHTLPITPAAAARALLDQRLRPAGGPDRLQAVIVDASIQEQPLETEGGLRGYLTTEAESRLDARLRVRVDRLDPSGAVVSSISTTASRTRSLPEGLGFAARQERTDELVRAVVDDLDRALAANLEESFSDLILP